MLTGPLEDLEPVSIRVLVRIVLFQFKYASGQERQKIPDVFPSARFIEHASVVTCVDLVQNPMAAMVDERG